MQIGPNSRAVRAAKRGSRPAAAAPPSKLPRAPGLVQPGDARTVVERRAVDIVVLGDSTLAHAAAYSLARTGARVVHLPHMCTPRAAPSLTPPPRPLSTLLDEPLLVGLAADSAAYWRGLAFQSGAPLLKDAPAVAIASGASGSAAGEQLSRILEACAAAGHKPFSLSKGELEGSFPAMALRQGMSGLLAAAAGGGLLLPAAADSALVALGARAGVLGRERLRLIGWRDWGDRFEVQASSALLPASVSVFEAEQLLLAPGDGAAEDAFRGFALSCKLRSVAAAVGRWSASRNPSRLPLWQVLGGDEDPRTGLSLPGCWGFPAASDAGRLGVAQLPASGALLDGATASPGAPWRPDPAAAAVALGALHAAATGVVAGLPADAAAGGDGTIGYQPLVLVDDGRPLLGFHPGFDSGRVMVTAASGGGDPSSQRLDGYQLSPLLAKWAADALRGAALPVEAAGDGPLGLQRAPLEAKHAALGIDPWDELQAFLAAPPGGAGEGGSAEERRLQQEEQRELQRERAEQESSSVTGRFSNIW